MAEFEGKCPDLLRDEKESERLLNLKLDSVDDDTIHNGVTWDPRNFKKNKEYGIAIFLIGITVTFGTHAYANELGYFIIAYGAVFTGGFLLLKGLEQEKIIKAHEQERDKDEVGEVTDLSEGNDEENRPKSI